MKFFRKTILSVLSISLWLGLSACGAKTNNNQNSSQKQQVTPNHNETSQPLKNHKQSANGTQSSQSQNNQMKSDPISGVWKATGTKDGVSSGMATENWTNI